MKTIQNKRAGWIRLFVQLAILCATSLVGLSTASAAVTASVRVAYQGVVQASGQSFTAGTSGTVTFSYTGNGTFVTTGSKAAGPPSDDLYVIVDGAQNCYWYPTTAPVSSGACGNTALVLGAGTHTIYAIADDQNGTSAQSATFSLTVLAPTLSVSPSSINFGSVSVSQNSPATNAVVTNSGGAASFAVSVGAPSAPFSAGSATCSAGSSLNSILAGGSCSVPYVFSPTAAGTSTQSLAVTSNGATIGNVALQGVGEPAPVAAISAPANGSSVVSGTSVTVSGSATQANGTIASLVLFDGATQISTAASSTLNYTAVFSIGTHTFQLKATNNINATAVSTPVTLTVGGAAALSVSPSSLNFGSMTTGVTSNAQSVAISNTGSAASGAISGAPTGPFASVGSTCSSGSSTSSILAGGSCTLSYTFTAMALGAANQNLPLSSNGTAIGTIAMSGTGVATSATPVPIVISVGHQSDPDAGSLPGDAAVSPSGALTYSIPIVVPPGTGGMAPQLALTYDSQGTNGILGMGWSLSGMSKIGRCGKTVVQDPIPGVTGANGINGRISFTTSDRLCLDGQRLIRVNGAVPAPDPAHQDAAYWASGGEYRTELDSFRRITMIAGPPATDMNGNPVTTTAFKVESRDGRVMTYGQGSGYQTVLTTDVFIPNSMEIWAAVDGGTPGSPADLTKVGYALSWALDSVTDVSGNTMAFDYTLNSTTGEHLLSQIRYGSNTPANQRNDLAVRFQYAARPDSWTKYIDDVHQDQRSRLSNIQTFIGTAGTATDTTGNLVRDYQLSYTQSPSSGRSLLTGVTACASNATAGTTCLPATTFQWGMVPSTAQKAFTSQGIFASPPNGPVLESHIGTTPFLDTGFFAFADFENNGRTDILVTRAALPNGSPPCVDQVGLPNCPGYEQANYGYFHNTGSGFVAYNYNISTGEAFVVVTTADFNGDGAPDLVVSTANGTARVCLSPLANPANLGPPGSTITFVCNASYGAIGANQVPFGAPLAIDVVGDGRAGLFLGPLGAPGPNYCLQSSCGTANNLPASVLGQFQNFDYEMDDPTHQFISFEQMIDMGGTGKPNDVRWSHAHFMYYIPFEYPPVKNPNPWYNLTPQVLVSAINVPGLPPQQDLTYTYPGYTNVPATAAALPYIFDTPAPMGGVSGDFNGGGYAGLFFGFLQIGTGQTGWTAPSRMEATQCLSTGRHLDCSVRQQISGGTNYSLQNYHRVLAVADFDGDGQPDLLAATVNANDTSVTGLQLCHLLGDAVSGTDTNTVCDTWAVPANVLAALNDDYSNTVSDRVFVTDFLGTGRPQLIYYHSGYVSNGQWVEDGRWEVFAPNDLAPAGQALDRIYQVTNGLGATATVTYEDGLTTGLVSRSGTSSLAYPQRLNAATGKFVSQIAKSNGVSPPRTVSYVYQDSAVDMAGRGSLGFGRVSSLDQQTLIQTDTTYNQVWPYIGTVKTEIRSAQPAGTTLNPLKPPGTVLSNTQNSWQQISTNSGTTTVFPYLNQQVVTLADLDGSPLGQKSTTPAYDSFGNLTTSTVVRSDSTGKQWTTVTGNASIVNTVTSTAWHLGQIGQTAVTKTNPDATTLTRTQKFTYDPTTALLATSTIEPTTSIYAVTSTILRDGFGNVKTTQQAWLDPGSNTNLTRLSVDQSWDAKGRFLTSVRNALAQQEGRVYDAATGQLLSHTDINGLTTSWTYDGFGKKLTETRSDGTGSKYFFKQCVGGDCTTPSGVATTASFKLDSLGASLIDTPTLSFADSAGHVLQTAFWHFSGQSEVQDQSFDEMGRPYITYRPRFTTETDTAISTRLYDTLDRQTSLTTPDGTSTSAFHGVRTVLKNNLGQTRTETRNVVAQLVTVLDSGNGTTGFTYEPFGSLAQTTDPNGNVSTVSYDRLGRRTALNDPDLGLRQYSVDPIGRVYSLSDPVMRAAGHSVSMGYDLLDRMTSRTEPDLTSAWVYDAQPKVGGVQQTPAQIATACAAAHSCGQLIEGYTQVPATGAKDYDRTEQYDSLGRLSSQVITLNAVAYTSGSSYDSWGRFLQRSSQHGTDPVKTFDYRYNAYGHLYRLERQALPLWMASQEDQLGNVTTAALGNQLVDGAQFDLLTGRLNTAQLSLAGAAQLQESYGYDALGNATSRSEYWGNGSSQQGFTETLTYDNLDRLHTAQVAAGGPLQTFTYDSAGNLLTKTGVGTGPYIYPAQGSTAVRPHAVQSITGLTGTFGYDANGNVQTTPFGRTQTWTSFDMPLVLSQGSNSSQFTYGPDHQRAKQIRSDGTTIWYAGAIEVETSASQTRVKTYWPQGLGLEIDVAGATQQLWMHRDRLGSVVAVSDINGAVQVQSGFDTWGLRRNLNGSAAATPIVETMDNKGFTGQEMLDQLALVHLNGRIYDPFVARFISADPHVTDLTNGQNYNRYSYVLNNPTNLTDPTGFDEAQESPCDFTCTGKTEEQIAYAKQLNDKISETKKAGGFVAIENKSGNFDLYGSTSGALAQAAQVLDSMAGTGAASNQSGVGKDSAKNSSVKRQDPYFKPLGEKAVTNGGSIDEQTAVHESLNRIDKTSGGEQLSNSIGPSDFKIHLVPRDGPLNPGTDVGKRVITVETVFVKHLVCCYVSSRGLADMDIDRVLSHEIGHLTNVGDDGPQKMLNVNQWENPIMRQVSPSQPDRVEYFLNFPLFPEPNVGSH
jgi:RHS repeat-associated protein